MLHEPNSEAVPRFLQVELNTIASSMASHSANTRSVHHYMLGRYGSGEDSIAVGIREHFGVKSGKELLQRLPENRALQQIPAAIARAHRAYSAPGSAVLFVVQEGERNFADQRWIEYALWEGHEVPVVRKSLGELRREASMDASGRLRLAGGQEVSVVYFRAGYSPDDYLGEAEWEARLLLERSSAIKCPSVDYQLVGAKKVQQALAHPGAVERFVGSRTAAKLRTCFAGLWGLGPGEEDEAKIIEMACKDPEAYVLKPQREGGGNNFYGKDVATKLKELSGEERGAYILMQRILPKLQTSVMTRAGTVQVMPGLSEFGFYSVYLGDGRRHYLSEHAGHLVRTKAEGVDEGGVAAGYAVISSPFLMK
jgi:glutathione synthase